MVELTLTRSSADGDLYMLDDVGSLRWESSKRPFVATALADGRSWRIAQDGMWRQHATVTDDAGARAGVYRTRGWTRSGGTILWEERELKLRPTALMHINFALIDAGRPPILLRGDANNDVVVSVEEPRDIDAGPLLLAVFAVRAQVLCTVPAGL